MAIHRATAQTVETVPGQATPEMDSVRPAERRESVSGGYSGNQAALRRLSRTPTIVQSALNSPTQPLDSSTRQFFEARFGAGFGRVRVHTNETAALSARTISALPQAKPSLHTN